LTSVVIFLQRGISERKQEQACLAFCDEQRWRLEHVVPWFAPRDAVKLVRAGLVEVVLAAFASPEVRRLAGDIGDAARVVVVHPRPAVVEPPARSVPASLAELVVRWFRRGRTPREIAFDLESSTRDVRDILRRSGEDPG
jgi:hypothetical protein